MMNNYFVLGRAQLGSQKVDVHAVAEFRYGIANLVRKITGLFR